MKVCRQFLSHFIHFISTQRHQYQYAAISFLDIMMDFGILYMHARSLYRTGGMEMIAQSFLICRAGQISLRALPSLSPQSFFSLSLTPLSSLFALQPPPSRCSASSHASRHRHRSTSGRPSARLILNYLVPCSLTFSFKSSPLILLVSH